MIEAMLMGGAGVGKQPQPVVDAGVEYGGGYYAGADIIVGSSRYLVIVAPKSQGESSSELRRKLAPIATIGATSRNDGRYNTDLLVASGASTHPAAIFCNDLVINGYDDWHLPSQDELEICYRYLKPTIQTQNNTSSGQNPSSVPPTSTYSFGNPARTSVAIFQSGGGESFDANVYWSSTENDSSSAWCQAFTDGYQQRRDKTTSYRVRAVRWEERQ